MVLVVLFSRRVRVYLGCLLGVLVAGLAGGAVVHFVHSDDVVPEVQRGTVTIVDQGVEAIGFRPDGQRSRTTGYVVSGSKWADRQGTWHDNGHPECLTAGSHGQRIEIGMVNVRPTGHAPGGPVVVWIRCL